MADLVLRTENEPTRNYARVAQEWFTSPDSYFQREVISFDEARGSITKLPLYFDPELGLESPSMRAMALGVAWYVLAIDRRLAYKLYDASVFDLGLRNDPGKTRPRAALDLGVITGLSALGGIGLLRRPLGGTRRAGCAVAAALSLALLCLRVRFPGFTPSGAATLVAALQDVGWSFAGPMLRQAGLKVLTRFRFPIFLLGITAALGVRRVGRDTALPIAALLASGGLLARVLAALAGAMAAGSTFLSLSLTLAIEFGEDRVAVNARRALAALSEPRWFGRSRAAFGFFFHLGEQWPRGQGSALLMTAEIKGRHRWSRIFRNRGFRARFHAPHARLPHISQTISDNSR